MYVLSFLYLQVWATTRKFAPKVADPLFATVYIVYNVLAHYAVTKYIAYHNLAPGPSLFLSIEQVCVCVRV